MYDRKVSVKCHEGEEKDGAVESNEVSTVDHLTQDIPKNPLRLVIDRQEGEAGGEQNVGEDQIQEEDVCHCVELLILVDDEEDKAVSKVTQEKVDVIEGWDDFCTEIVDGLLRTEFDRAGDHVAQVSDVGVFIQEVQEHLILVVFQVHH